MSGASNYVENMIINALLRGGTFTVPSAVYIALHTSDPGDTGANEVSTAAWPAYTRRDSADGGALADAWSAASNGESTNQNQILFPVQNGASSITVTHFSLWDASSGGNCLMASSLDSSRTLQPGDVFVVDPDKLTARQV